MSYPQAFTQQWLGYLSFLSDRSMATWNQALQDIQDRKYDPGKAMSDMLGLWNDAAVGWFAAWRGADQMVPTLFFDLAGDDESATACVPIFAPSLPNESPHVAFLKPIVGGNPAEINDTKCTLTLSTDERELALSLDGLRTQADPPLTQGVYQGLVHMGEVPIALIYIRVHP